MYIGRGLRGCLTHSGCPCDERSGAHDRDPGSSQFASSLATTVLDSINYYKLYLNEPYLYT